MGYMIIFHLKTEMTNARLDWFCSFSAPHQALFSALQPGNTHCAW
tara:strand:- start:788 stop:922 length:135 start_codon:yes stop_codon:yes gene_type:complete